jgi:hypothetical protein
MVEPVAEIIWSSGTVMVEPVAAELAATTVAVPPKNDRLDNRDCN